MQEGLLRRANAVAGPEKIRLREHERWWQPAGADQFLRPVAIREDPIDERGALNERCFERRPLLRRQHERHRVNLPGPLHAARVAIDVIRDALLTDEAADGVGAALQFGLAQPVEVANQRDEVGAGSAGGREQFVIGAADRSVIGEQRDCIVNPDALLLRHVAARVALDQLLQAEVERGLHLARRVLGG